jgi:hypothetical protein
MACHGAARRLRHCAPARHCEERSNPSAVAQRPGLPRRCAPRNDAVGPSLPLPRHWPPPRHCEERSNPSAVAQRPGLPRRCAPRNDGRGYVNAPAPPLDPAPSLDPRPVIRPPPRHCEERSNPSAVARRPGLPRRCAPRNDGRGYVNAPAPPLRPSPSLRGTKQSIGGCTKTWIATALRASQ